MAENIRSELFKWARPHWWRVAVAALCVLAVSAIEVALPKLFGDYLVDDVLIDRRSLSLLTTIALAGIAAIFVKGLFYYGQVYLMSYVGQKLVYELRGKMYRRLLEMPLGQHARQKSGQLISRMTSDIGVIQSAVTAGLADLLTHAVMFTAIVAVLLWLNWELALVSFATLPVAAWAIQGYGRRIRAFTARLQERIARLTSTLQESLEGIRIVKAFHMERERRARFEKDNRDSFGASMKSVQAAATMTPIVELILASGMMIVIWYGGRAVVLDEMSTGEFIAFLLYLTMLARPISYFSKSFSLIQQAVSAAERVSEVLNFPVEEAEDGEGKVRLERVKGRIEFEHVSFEYSPGVQVLHDISLVAEPGEVVALVGPSGAGKSTLVNLIPRFFRPTSGRVLIDGHDLGDIELASLRRQIGLVPQETLLFGMTVAENIAAGREWIGEQEIVEAAKMANAHEFITALPDGYHTLLGERGATLSGGQRQRIAIARAVAGDPRILILDEATSALDAESEAQVRSALMRVQRDRTTIVIAHRLSTVRGADKIAVLDKGRLVEAGTHEELMKTGKLYPRLYRTQFGDDAYPGAARGGDVYPDAAAEPLPGAAGV